MSSEQPSTGDELQFDTIEPANPAAAPTTTACLACKRPITSTYYAISDKIICPDCRAQLEASPKGRRIGRLSKAGVLGLLAGLAGAILWYVIRRVTNYEIGLVAVLVGFMVGKAVRKGSGGRGGRGYQIMAVVITYCCIAGTYMPDLLTAMLKDYDKDHPAAVSTAKGDHAKSTDVERSTDSSTEIPSAEHVEKPSVIKAVFALILVLLIVFVFSLAVPFMSGASNLIGLLIIGFALWEAWKLNRRMRLPITGPYTVGPPRLPPAMAGGAV
jgi:hypothetical protein